MRDREPDTVLEKPYRDPETDEERTGALLGVERPIIQIGGKLRDSKPKTKMGQRRVFLDHETAENCASTVGLSSDCGCKWAVMAGQRPGFLPG